MKSYPLSTDPSIPLSFSGPTPPAGCVQSIPATPDLTDDECWQNIFPIAPAQPTLAATSMTCAVDHTVVVDELPSFPFELSTYFDVESDYILGAPPCQPRPCASGIRLSFDWSIDAELTDLVGDIQASAHWRIFAEIIEMDISTGEPGSAVDEVEVEGDICASSGAGEACDGGLSSTVSMSGSHSLEIAPGVIPPGNLVGADIGGTFSGSSVGAGDSYRLVGSIVISNLAWEAI